MTLTKRDQILLSAMHLFIEKGIHATATAQIAKEAGVATGTLFHHFKSKEELVSALYHTIYDSLLSYKNQGLNPLFGVYEQLRSNWILDIEWATSHQEYFHFLERYSFLHYMSESEISKIYDRFEGCMELFRRAIGENLLRSDDFDYVHDHFVWNIRMNMAFFIEHPERCTAENVEKSFEIYWKGISNA